MRVRLAVLAVLAASATNPAVARAQQYITDDAAITEYLACQIQVWHGERASWVFPVCTPIPRVELSLGFIAVWDDGSDGHFEYAAQAKTIFRHLAPDSWGAGVVIGTGRDPAFSGTANETNSYYAYIPLSLSLAHDRLVLHQNTGWLLRRVPGLDDHKLTWALRGDVRVQRRLTVIADFYGATRLGRKLPGTSGTKTEFQAGLRTSARRERVAIDLSYGAELRSLRRAQGWTIGLTLITPPFL